MTPFQKLVGLTALPAVLLSLGIWTYLMWRDGRDTHNLKIMNHKMNEFMYDKMRVNDMEMH